MINISSTRSKGQKLTHWKQSVPIPSWLFALGAADFAVQYREPWQGKPIETWVYRQDRVKGFYDFAEPTTGVLDFYSAYIGPFAFEKLANVEANSVGGATELATCIFYSDKSVTGERTHYWQTTIAHEIAHHWFGNCVTEQNWDDAWLSEGFATYFSFMFIGHAYGHDALTDEMLAARKKVFSYYEKHKDYRIVHDHLADMNQVTNIQAYQKGAWILHMLRAKLGDEAFQKGIRLYYRDHFNGNATTSDFKRAMESASGMQLDTFFTQWLYRGGNPKLSCKYTCSNSRRSLHLEIKQVQNDGFIFNLPVEIGLYYQGQALPEIKKVNINSLSVVFDIPLTRAPLKIVVDPRTVLLAETDLIQQR